MKPIICYALQEELTHPCTKEFIDALDIIIYSKDVEPLQMDRELAMIRKMATDTKVFVENNLEMMERHDCDGLYIPYSVENPVILRERVGKRKEIAVNVRNLRDLEIAGNLQADMIVLGSMFINARKERILEMEELRMIRTFWSDTLLISGGLTVENISEEMRQLSDGFIFSSYLNFDEIKRLELIRERFGE